MDIVEKMGFMSAQKAKEKAFQESMELKFARDMTTYKPLGTP